MYRTRIFTRGSRRARGRRRTTGRAGSRRSRGESAGREPNVTVPSLCAQRVWSGRVPENPVVEIVAKFDVRPTAGGVPRRPRGPPADRRCGGRERRQTRALLPFTLRRPRRVGRRQRRDRIWNRRRRQAWAARVASGRGDAAARDRRRRLTAYSRPSRAASRGGDAAARDRRRRLTAYLYLSLSRTAYRGDTAIADRLSRRHRLSRTAAVPQAPTGPKSCCREASRWSRASTAPWRSTCRPTRAL